MKKVKPAMGTKYALTVKRCRIWWTGNQIAGRLQNQNRKKLTKSLVFVPELAGMELGRSLYDVQIDRIMSVTHSPASWVSFNVGTSRYHNH